MTTKNIGEFVANLGKVEAEMKQKAIEACGLMAEYLLGETIPYTPELTGTLRQSGKASYDEDKPRSAVSFNTPYAVAQHENLTYHHKYPTEAKFLENRMNDPAVQEGMKKVAQQHMKVG